MVTFESVQRYRLAGQVANRISTSILDGELAPCSRLPSERELAAKFNVSRPTLREAIHVLEALGLVEARHGDGTYVSKNPSALSPRVLKQLLERDDALLFDMIETRKEFEARNAELAAKHATEEHVRRLFQILDEMEADIRAGREEFEHELDFHLTIAEASHNRIRFFITTSMLLAHAEMLREARRQMVRRHARLLEDFLHEHRAIALCIEARDPEKARAAMHTHLEVSYAHYTALGSESG
jgi:GntR family transcriptional repressor for pyruvate dehydrogenase complex